MTRTCCRKRGGEALPWTLYPVTLERSDESLVSGSFTTEYTSWTENTTCLTSSLRGQDSGLWSTRVWRLGQIAVCARRWVEGVMISKIFICRKHAPTTQNYGTLLSVFES